ncbi:hypothetical protein Syun_009734 [Stephania yunnanensis]|uniref:Reverse transcriptase domain-containing protein n=1 Tax=Stephania yunnanensis TaxID=152371 RepID=A0AAP0KHQ1_9MAGN
MKMFRKFHSSGHFERDLNEAHIVLIPKISFPQTLSEYRPISLCNSLYKLLSKVLANRLKTVLDRLISPFQNEFVAGRQITDNILLAHEILHSMERGDRRSLDTILKLHISKAYDKLEWSIVLEMLRRMGFSQRWCRWIEECITTVLYRVIINGELSKVITPTRGIRQGDPISPSPFLICSEALSFLLGKGEREGQFHGFKLNHSSPSIPHLIFVDDTLLFCKANVENI